MSFIVQGILDYSQIKSNQFQMNIEEFNVCKAIDKVMRIQKDKAKQNDIQFTVEYENLSKTLQDRSRLDIFKYSPLICCDKQRFMQVLLILQSNALKFTTVGSVTHKVKIVEIDNYKFIQISVVDTGVGIAQ